MSPDEFRAVLLRVAERLAQAIATYIRLLPPDPPDAVWRDFLDAVFPHIRDARRESYLAACEYYGSQRPADTESAPDISERGYSVRALDKALTRVTRARLEGLEDLESLDRDALVSDTLATAERHAMAAGRDYVSDVATRDPAAIGYARVPSGAETCAFCTILTSRGLVYESKGSGSRYTSASGRTFTAGDGGNEPYHDNCDCVVVPVFNRQSWPGRDQYLDAERTYKRALRKYPDLTPIQAVRKELESGSST